MSAALVIAGYALRESVRRRVFAVVISLTALFLLLYALGVNHVYGDVHRFAGGSRIPVSPSVLAGATLVGLATFATLFLGTVLAVFLTLGAVRGEAERGLLQPLVVRPIGRPAVLLGRFAAAAAVCAGYLIVVWYAAVVITGTIGGWWPDRLGLPAVELAAAGVLLVGLSLLGSVLLSTVANGIAVFMIFGAGLVAGLLGQIGQALNEQTLRSIAHDAAWALPFEALYENSLAAITSGTAGFTKAALQLGPFGGAHAFGAGLAPWSVFYLALVLALGLWAFARRDL